MDAYSRLARHLDNLPGGFPATESGVELRILRRLFSPEQAGLALHLTLLAEPPRVIAWRASLPVDETARRLEDMAAKGLIFRSQSKGKLPHYMAAQFVIGIWEYHVNSLDLDLVHDFDEYLPELAASGAWDRVPQLRTIPVAESIQGQPEVLPYWRAEELVRAQTQIAVAPCICRRERRLAGEGCDKPLETCLTFGMGARFYLQNGLGRAIGQAEALDILRQADAAGLVLQPGNAKHAMNICACCGCCCGVLRSMKRQPSPASWFASPFRAIANPATCAGCGACVDRCQMEALQLDNGKVLLDPERCIGCGLCVTTCPTGSLSLVRKPHSAQPHVPRDIVDTTLKLGRARGKLSMPRLVGMLFRSARDRLLAPR